ncbi:MAG: UvrD-helicase domain-containing protein [Gammaproteobacteria bacterium]
MTEHLPDQAERAFATDVGRSVIVQAPAGSGKTTLLVERYLKLLSLVEAPEQILAITFTRKAASEMQSRILAALSAAAGSAADPGHPAAKALAKSRALGWDLPDSPGRLKIQTIDAFALSLARSMPIAAGFDPQAALTENATDLYASAASRLLLRLYQRTSSNPMRWHASWSWA